jgi:hypothetical protein
MKTSDLVAQLQALITTYGDLDVYMEDEEGEGYCSVTHSRLVHLLNMHDVAIRDVIGIAGSEEQYERDERVITRDSGECL